MKTFYLVHFKGHISRFGNIDGYYSEIQRGYEWEFTNDIHSAKLYATEQGAYNRIKQAKSTSYKDLEGTILTVTVDIVIQNKITNKQIQYFAVSKLLKTVKTFTSENDAKDWALKNPTKYMQIIFRETEKSPIHVILTNQNLL